jgi:hypothetical protein
MNRRLWVVLLVMASLLPWRVALACAHQAGLVQERCCCLQHIKTGVGKCCKTVIAAPAQLADSQADTLPSPDGGKPLAPPPTSVSFTPLPTASGRSVRWLVPDRSWLIGNETYLQTARLRL